MIVIGVIFVTLFLWLLFLKNHNAQKVKQFNIVFSPSGPTGRRPRISPGTSSPPTARPWAS